MGGEQPAVRCLSYRQTERYREVPSSFLLGSDLMAESAERWSRWLLHDRFGGDELALQRTLEYLEPIRDRVLAAARINPGAVVMDVGCGDGLLGFGALPMVGAAGRVVFADVSKELLQRCRDIAAELDVSNRCRFVHTGAERLDGIDDGSVDAVMTRSVLIYVDNKAGAFAAFHRVLRPGGRISLFEPINRRFTELNKDTLFGYLAAPIKDLADKVWAVFKSAAPADGPMMGFDETDLFRLAESEGFSEITVTLDLSSTEKPPFAGVSWNELMKISPNPHAPTFGEAINQVLDADEASRLESYLRPLVDQSAPGRFRTADAYVSGRRTAP